MCVRPFGATLNWWCYLEKRNYYNVIIRKFRKLSKAARKTKNKIPEQYQTDQVKFQLVKTKLGEVPPWAISDGAGGGSPVRSDCAQPLAYHQFGINLEPLASNGRFFFWLTTLEPAGILWAKIWGFPLSNGSNPQNFRACGAHMPCFSLVIPRLPAGSKDPFRIEPKKNLPYARKNRKTPIRGRIARKFQRIMLSQPWFR